MPNRQKRLPNFLNEIELAKLLSSPDRISDKRLTKFKIRDHLDNDESLYYVAFLEGKPLISFRKWIKEFVTQKYGTPGALS